MANREQMRQELRRLRYSVPITIPPRKCLKCGKLLEPGEPRLFGEFILISLCQEHAVERLEKEYQHLAEIGPEAGLKELGF